MVTSISFGNFSTIGGKQVLTGGNSGIDTQGLITALTTAKRAPAVALEAKQKTYAQQTSAFDDLSKLLSNFQSSADLLRGQPGILDQDKNVFNYRATTITATNTTQSGDSFVSATVASGTAPQTYSITDVTSLAAAKKQQTNTFALSSVNDSVVVAGAGAGQFEAATVTIKGQAITLNIGDSLQTVSNAFNAVSATTGIKSSILQTSTGQYSLIFTSTKTGLAADFDLNDAGTVSDPNGVLANIGITDAQPAANAVFKIDGIAVQRESNTISDLVDGVTLTIKQTTPAAAQIDVNIVPDTTTAKNAITTFLDDYNNLRLFFAKQTATNDDGTPKSTKDADGNNVVSAVLFNNSTLRSITNSSLSQLTGTVDGIAGGLINKLSDIGVTVGDYAGDADNPSTRNILVLDDSKLTSALTSNFDQVKSLFQFSSTTSNSALQIYKRPNNLKVTDFTISADPVGGVYTANYMLAGVSTTVNLTATAITGGGTQLVGPDGSAIAGLQMIYSASVAGTSTVHTSQGIADKIYNDMTADLDTTKGSVTNEINSLKTKNDSATTNISRIDDIVDRYRSALLDRFAKLESALSSVNTILQTLDANAKAQAAAGG